jgi:hypothetical protein
MARVRRIITATVTEYVCIGQLRVQGRFRRVLRLNVVMVRTHFPSIETGLVPDTEGSRNGSFNKMVGISNNAGSLLLPNG